MSGNDSPNFADAEKRGNDLKTDPVESPQFGDHLHGDDVGVVHAEGEGKLKPNLRGRHMQMIAM